MRVPILTVKDEDGNIIEIPAIAGKKGEDGVSPIVTVSKNGKITTITIIDAEGTKTATIVDGENGGGTGGITEETDPTVPDWAKQASKPSYKTSEIENNSGYVNNLTKNLVYYYKATEIDEMLENYTNTAGLNETLAGYIRNDQKHSLASDIAEYGNLMKLFECNLSSDYSEEKWTFTLEDGSTVEKTVVLHG